MLRIESFPFAARPIEQGVFFLVSSPRNRFNAKLHRSPLGCAAEMSLSLEILIEGNGRGPPPPMPRLPSSQEIFKALLRDYEAHHHPLIKALLRPAISWGGLAFGGVPLDSHDFLSKALT